MSEEITQDVAEQSAPVVELQTEESVGDGGDHDDIYDTAVQELLSDEDGGDTDLGADDIGDAETADDAGEPAGDQTAEDLLGFEVSEEDQALFVKNGLDADALKGLPEEQVNAIATALRAKQPEEEPEAAEPEQPSAPAKDSLRGRIDGLRKELIEAYDEDIAPVVDVLGEIAAETEQLQEARRVLDVVGPLVEDMAVAFAFNGLGDAYEGAGEKREQVLDRFATEIAARAQSKPNEPAMQRIRGAMEDAAKHVLAPGPRQAVEELTKTNRDRVRSQPPRGRTKERKRPLTEDDVYDQAFEEHLA